MEITTTESNHWFSGTFTPMPLMAILRGFGPQRSVELATTAWELGLTCVEIPIQSEEDLESLAAVVAAGRAHGRPVGAGTVVTVEHVLQAAAGDAAFTVSPGFDQEVVKASLDAGMPSLPGVATASEIQSAMGLGLAWVKAFPASVLGTGWFKAQHGPFPQLNIVATGGIDASNVADYWAAGAQVGAIGSALADPDQLTQLASIISRRPVAPF
jgi:2-dehydro-3-deoxyphosphogluconate aldolase / (4S)-4-hydroxy-2-oxoglutarate aldolase